MEPERQTRHLPGADLDLGARCRMHAPKDSLPRVFRFRCGRGDREAFATGELRDVWRRQYAEIFDDDCCRITLRQPEYHFNEWFAAVRIYEEYGWLSLVEQYEFKNHQRKRGLVSRIVTQPDLLQFILMGPTARRAADAALTGQCPDLLCYAPDLSEWFFCEVKCPPESQTAGQRALFPRLEQLAEEPIRLAEITHGNRTK